MSFEVSLDLARSYTKADGDDDELLKVLIASAQSICEGYCNRRFYVDDAAASDGFGDAMTDWTTAADAQASQMAAATSDAQRDLIANHYIEVFGRIKQRSNGVVMDGSIQAAMLLTVGHLYVNREDNVVSGNNAVQLPVGAQRILQPYLWFGDFAGS